MKYRMDDNTLVDTDRATAVWTEGTRWDGHNRIMREELNEAIACTERDFARGVRSTVRVSAYTDGRKARNLQVYRGIGGLYVILGFRRKHPTMLKDMAGGVHICRFDGKPVVVTYLECAHEQTNG